MKIAAHKLQATGFPSAPLNTCEELNPGAFCPVSFQALNSKFNVIYVSATLSESYTHLSELTGALSVHVTDSSSSLKDTFEPIPSWATHRSIHRLRAAGLCSPALVWGGKAREKETKREKWTSVGWHRGVEAWREDEKYAEQTRAGSLDWDGGGEWDEIVFKHSLWCRVNLAAPSTYVCMQRQTGAEEITARRQPTGTLPELFTKGNGTQTLNPEPVSGHWDYEKTMTHEWCQECVSTNVNQPWR